MGSNIGTNISTITSATASDIKKAPARICLKTDSCKSAFINPALALAPSWTIVLKLTYSVFKYSIIA